MDKNNNALSVFAYQGNKVTFQQGTTTMVNATEMAKPFKKEPKFWLSNQSTADYLTELSKVRNLTLADLVKVTKGGNSSGTWMHEDVALEFARWLSPSFAIWCNDRIKELLLSEYVALPEASDFFGVKPVIYNGQAWYYFRDVVTAIGMSRKSGTTGRYVARYPTEIARINGRIYCSLKIAKLVQKRHEYRREINELTAMLANEEGGKQ